MVDYKFSENGYWIEPDGTIHAMTEWQAHASWIATHLHGDEFIGHMKRADYEAEDRGWARITFANNNCGFDVSFDREAVTKEAVRSVRRILKDHQPDKNIVVISEKFDLMRDADRALAQYPCKSQVKNVVEPKRVETPKPVTSQPVQAVPRRPVYKEAWNSPERQEELRRQFIERMTETTYVRYFKFRPLHMHMERIQNGGDWERHELMGVPNFGYHPPHRYGDKLYFAAGGLSDDVTPHYVEFREDGYWYAYINSRSHDRYNSYGEMYVAMLRLVSGMARDARSISEHGYMEVETSTRKFRMDYPDRKGTPIPQWAQR